MVNENSKYRILSILKDSDGYVSGDTISSLVSISRVAVWKNINYLTGIGYPISAGKKGYHLEADYDLVCPYEFTGNIQYIYKEKTDSTMAYPENMSLPNENFISVADSQTKGRGRYERKWISDEGGLYFTVFMKKINLPAHCMNFIPLYAACILVQAIKNIYGISTLIKWPNDIYYNTKKLAGILVNSACQGSMVTEIAVGIGININNNNSHAHGISVSKIRNTRLKRQPLLNEFYQLFRKSIHSIDREKITAFYNENSFLFNKSIEAIDDFNRKISGTAGFLDENGGLLIRQKSNSPIPVYSCKNMKIIN